MLFRSALSAYSTVTLPDDVGQAVIAADAAGTPRPQHITGDGFLRRDLAADVSYPADVAVRTPEEAAEWLDSATQMEAAESDRRFADDQRMWA